MKRTPLPSRAHGLGRLFGFGLTLAVLLGQFTASGQPLPQDKQAFLGLWKTRTGYALEFSTNGTVRMTQAYELSELRPFSFERSWNEGNVPLGPGPDGHDFRLWKVEFQEDDFLQLSGPGDSRRYKINLYPFTEGDQTKMFLNEMEFIREPQPGLSTPVPASDPLDLPIKDRALAARIQSINAMTDQVALAKLACKERRVSDEPGGFPEADRPGGDRPGGAGSQELRCPLAGDAQGAGPGGPDEDGRAGQGGRLASEHGGSGTAYGPGGFGQAGA